MFSNVDISLMTEFLSSQITPKTMDNFIVYGRSRGKPYSEWYFRKNGSYTELKKIVNKKIHVTTRNSGNSVTIATGEREKMKMESKQSIMNCNIYKLELNKELTKVVVLPDMHIPEHDERALNCVKSFVDYYKPDVLVYLGDTMEMSSVSHWDNKYPSFLKDELNKTREIMSMFNHVKQKVFLVGNHENWLEQYLVSHVPEILSVVKDSMEFNMKTLLKLHDYTLVPYNDVLKIGHAHFVHGLYCQANHAKKHLETFGANVYYGHTHDIQAHSATSIYGIHEAMSLGCLRKLNAGFLNNKPSNWIHAFGVFEFLKDGQYSRYVPTIINGKFSFNGKLFQ